jgi:hypothetical protein
MNRRPFIYFALAFSGCAGLAGAAPAGAAAVQGRATAIITQGVSIRSPRDETGGAHVQVTSAQTSVTRNVERPCRPGDPESASCRVILLEMQ